MAGTTETRSGIGHSPHSGGGKNIHHGRTLAAWVGSLAAMVAVVIGGIAVMIQNWPLFWASVAFLVLGLIATKVLQAKGHGAD
jgi:hypothetical protein